VTLKTLRAVPRYGRNRTYAIQIRDLFLPTKWCSPIGGPYVRKSAPALSCCRRECHRAGADCVRIMEESGRARHVTATSKPSRGHRRELAGLEREVSELPAPLMSRARLLAPRDRRTVGASEAAVNAAHYAMLHCGARYVHAHRCQRRLREAYLFAIVTPPPSNSADAADLLPNVHRSFACRTNEENAYEPSPYYSAELTPLLHPNRRSS